LFRCFFNSLLSLLHCLRCWLHNLTEEIILLFILLIIFGVSEWRCVIVKVIDIVTVRIRVLILLFFTLWFFLIILAAVFFLLRNILLVILLVWHAILFGLSPHPVLVVIIVNVFMLICHELCSSILDGISMLF